ncbi:MAG: mechanosensitive ion channel family protein [Actinobacteria bacterium]|nr:mechanosensitive ion channel family protein [Actinomycetota bacterium]MBU1493762.1 mechanosensitive ion channel family protein [Actinomycetota bacterium]
MVDRIAEVLNISDWQAKLIVTGAVVVVLAVLRWLVLVVVRRRIEDSSVWYRTRKLLSYAITLVGLVVLVSMWLEGSGLATYIGFLTAGVAIALSDVLKNLAGWALIVLRRQFRVGDRIEIVGHRGDVVDIRAFRFTLLEVGNRNDAEQATGRLLHVPNGLVFTEVLANFTSGFEYIWHEIPVLITFESDWEAAEGIILAAVRSQALDQADPKVAAELRATAARYQIRFTHLTPITYLTVKDSGVLITGRLLVPARGKRIIEQEIWKAILRGFKERPDIHLAYPTIRTYFDGPIGIDKK